MRNKVTLVTLAFFVYVVFWVLLHTVISNYDYRNYFTDTYGILALIGGSVGLLNAKNWGSFKSFVGKSMIFFSLGLITQFLGQFSYTILFYLYNIENAYPAFGEIFYLSTIPLYILGTFYIAKASGFQYSLGKVLNRIWPILIPVLMLLISYNMFLKNYDFTDMPFINIFLDFFYPIGQAMMVAFAIVVYATTYDVLGGLMKRKVRFILFALVFQYVADSMFIYETINDLWGPAGLSDLMFIGSYFLMSVSLIWLDGVKEGFKKIN